MPEVLVNRFNSQVCQEKSVVSRPPDKNAYWKIILFLYFSSKTNVVGTQKNRLNETVLLRTQNTCLNEWVRKIIKILCK